MMRISKLKLANWKNFRHVEADLASRVFLVGPNASGKSNFLDSLRFLRDLAIPGGGFQTAVHLRGGVSKLRCLSARQRPDIRIEATLEDGDEPNRWTYALEFGQDNNRNPKIITETVDRNGVNILSRPDTKDKEDPALLSQTALEQVTANGAFRQVATFLQSVTYLHLVPQVIRRPQDFSLSRVENDPYGMDFIDKIGRVPTKTREARLRKILDALKIAVPHLSQLSWGRDREGLPHLLGRYDHWRPHGAEQREEQFSDGTLRLLGLLWSLLDGAGPLLLEEPELSLHSAVVRRLSPMIYRMQKLRQRQVFVSTHSSDLLSDPGIDADETLLLIPGKEGTEVKGAGSIAEIKILLEAGLSISEAVLPHTNPPQIQQLELFS